MIELILGGARSGKSSLAQQRAISIEKNKHAQVVYIATGQAKDDEMQARIKLHQQQRPAAWQLIETPITLAKTIEQLTTKAQKNNEQLCIIIDCLTLWVTNCLCTNTEIVQATNIWQQQKQDFLLAISSLIECPNIQLIIVSNEVGHGIVPLGELSREFVDQTGWLHQDIAKIAQQVDFVMAGIPLRLKPQATPQCTELQTNKDEKNNKCKP